MNSSVTFSRSQCQATTTSIWFQNIVITHFTATPHPASSRALAATSSSPALRNYLFCTFQVNGSCNVYVTGSLLLLPTPHPISPSPDRSACILLWGSHCNPPSSIHVAAPAPARREGHMTRALQISHCDWFRDGLVTQSQPMRAAAGLLLEQDPALSA